MFAAFIRNVFYLDFTKAMDDFKEEVARKEYKRGYMDAETKYYTERRAEESAYDKLSEEIKSEAFVDSVVARIKAKQIK